MAKYAPLEKRLPNLYLIKADTGCWIWQQKIHRDGYAKIGQNYKTHQAHRVVYELLVGPIPEGKQLDHLCRNRACINPEHLEPVTAKENILRGESFSAKNARKTHCIHGHELSGDNLRILKHGRVCLECRRTKDRIASKKWYAENAKPKIVKTHCIQGHEFTEENTEIRTRKSGGRKCRTCHKISGQKSNDKRRLARQLKKQGGF